MRPDIEHFDQLIDYLEANHVVPSNDVMECKILRGGVSNKAVLVKCSHHANVVAKQALRQLRVQEEWRSDPARIIVEANALRMLRSSLGDSAIPRLYYLDEDNHILVMEAVPEECPNWKNLLLQGEVSMDLVREFAHLIASIHALSWESETWRSQFSEKHFYDTLRVDPYYRFTATMVPKARDFLLSLCEETMDISECFVHGDYSPKNVMVSRDHLVLLDYEVGHFGDGAFDIGFALTHFLSKSHFLRQHEHQFLSAATQFWTTYSRTREVTFEFEARAVRHTVACMLARVRGKSPLEYLDDAHQSRQTEICLGLMNDTPQRITDLIETWKLLLHAND